MTSYTQFYTRILDILKADHVLAEKVGEFRLGDQGDLDETVAQAYPLIYTTAASNPEVERITLTSSSPDKLPGQKRTLEFWAVIVVEGGTSQEAQEQLFDLSDDVIRILSDNVQLKRPDDFTDPICSICDIFMQRRHEKHRGSLVEAMTIRVRPTVFVI